ncbi:MAG: cobalamin-binding protein [Peptococcaceae bacterium]|nr:cobalamin-binding protein [Peptococcaceae bacterium]
MIDLKKLTDAIGELDEDKLLELLNQFVAKKPTNEEAQAVVNACQEGMTIVGNLFQSGEYFVGDLIFAGELLTESIEILKPIIGGGNPNKVAKIVLGTVEGDLHDIGKNIFRSMAEAAGFAVYDLGIDQNPNAFVAKVREIRPEIVGMSGLLSIALESMKKTVDSLRNAGLRENLKIIIGGNPVSAEACAYIGADAFTTNASDGITICQQWVK